MPRKIDVRVIAATARDLDQEVRLGLFRQDLFYRLNVVRIHLPPLRERLDDIPLLSEFFFSNDMHAGSIRRSRRWHLLSWRFSLQYGWPGNVRELEKHH